MIEYTNFWILLEKSGESTYTLIHKYHVSSSTIHKLRHNLPLTTTTLNDLCRILKCNIGDICNYVPSEFDQVL